MIKLLFFRYFLWAFNVGYIKIRIYQSYNSSDKNVIVYCYKYWIMFTNNLKTSYIKYSYEDKL